LWNAVINPRIGVPEIDFWRKAGVSRRQKVRNVITKEIFDVTEDRIEDTVGMQNNR
jgi:hypothetical protein